MGRAIPTIGFGHLIHPGRINGASSEKPFKNGITEAAANDLLREDLGKAEKPINDQVAVPLTQHQFDALVSLILNIGITAFRDSTLLKMLNGGSGYHTGDYLSAAEQFSAWDRVTVHGVRRSSKNLIKRRTAEEALFLRR